MRIRSFKDIGLLGIISMLATAGLSIYAVWNPSMETLGAAILANLIHINANITTPTKTIIEEDINQIETITIG